ncbi:Sedlin, N-terminal conserved region containing protein, putative [Trypanosoma equiperdum]|uniref:Sedlin n=2 Tax=Trypanozoon TaxID=39700 RepID=Q38FR0_TRYB2|nr:hypothetical protein, conserved [Trypanosoma brucei brucei TREU927]EAN76360.1 hypothetical protein, conserved [Trypanosoma brucei brucei TREU927]SCU66997.1 Sedlin, N-terminal conserved region containing protein, putative [Trypanosoma equiperdum]
MSTAQSWAVAALALFSGDGKPLIIRTFTSPNSGHGGVPAVCRGGVFVGEEDVMRLHVLILSSLDRCDEIVQERRKQQMANVEKSGDGSASPRGSARVTAGADVRFLGKLIRSYTFTTYGFQSASGIRTVLAVVGDAPLDAVLPLCRSTYEAASAALCNPFCLTRTSAELLRRLCRTVRADIIGSDADVVKFFPLSARDAMDEDPSLANSRAFNMQIQTNIEPFTASAFT